MALLLQMSVFACLVVGALNAWSYFHQRNGEWHFVDGTDQMRRWMGYEWQYRSASDSEKLQHEESMQW